MSSERPNHNTPAQEQEPIRTRIVECPSARTWSMGIMNPSHDEMVWQPILASEAAADAGAAVSVAARRNLDV